MPQGSNMGDGLGASVPDQALAVPAEPVARLGPLGFDPSRGERELWRSGDHSYPDRVFVTERGDIGMKADFGREIVKRIGEWCYLVHEVEHLKAGYKAFPADVARVMSVMGGSEGVLSAATISSEVGLPEKRVKDIHKALKALGLARFGQLCDADADGYVARGSGYWLSRNGDDLARGYHASAIEARSDATGTGAAEGESAVAKPDAQPGADNE